MKNIIEHMKNKYNVDLGEDASVDEFIEKYIEQKGAKAAIVYPQEMSFINLTITNFCNLACNSCDQFIDSAIADRSDHLMTVQQVKDFVKESQETNWKWQEIRVTGGEPTLHPNFFEILTILDEGLKQKYLPNLTLKIISNGTGKKVRKLLDIENAKIVKGNKVSDHDRFSLEHINYPNWTVVCSKPLKDTMEKVDRKEEKNSPKDKNHIEFIPDFGNVWQAPVDRLEEIAAFQHGDTSVISYPPLDGYYPPKLTRQQKQYIADNNIITDCQVHSSCGFELSIHGISPCGCGGGRVVRNKNQFFNSLKDVTKEECYNKLAKMCLTCGQNMNYMVQCSTRNTKTEFWDLILNNYYLNKSELQRYNPYNEEINEDK